MTRKIDPAERRRRKLMWQFDRMTKAIACAGVSATDMTRHIVALTVLWTGKAPAYNWPETPERSAMHAAYHRRRK